VETSAQKLGIARVAAFDSPVPASRVLEASVLPDVDVIVGAAQKLVAALDG
jgi:pyruvate/2-oxoglutarate/acetoin dehydrogenase E1 component